MRYSGRPQVGDTVRMNDTGMTGKVVATFYENGWGMHVAFEHGISWASSDRVTVIRKAVQA